MREALDVDTDPPHVDLPWAGTSKAGLSKPADRFLLVVLRAADGRADTGHEGRRLLEEESTFLDCAPL